MTLYPIASSGSIDMLGDEFPDPQTFARPSPLTDEQRYAEVLLRRKFMRETWGLSEAEIDRLEPDECAPVNLLDAVRAAELTKLDATLSAMQAEHNEGRIGDTPVTLNTVADLVCAAVCASISLDAEQEDGIPAMEVAV
jgi:hypothetical protein